MSLLHHILNSGLRDAYSFKLDQESLWSYERTIIRSVSYRHMVQIWPLGDNYCGGKVPRDGDADKMFIIVRVDIPEMSL